LLQLFNLPIVTGTKYPKLLKLLARPTGGTEQEPIYIGKYNNPIPRDGYFLPHALQPPVAVCTR
jgi:hypothetical protein